MTLKLGSRFTLVVMSGLGVSELAERAGVTPSTVRFYERVGLLSPARRGTNGYRLFEESALEELAFVSRAKGIGMSLEEIADLVTAWPNGECRSLQARLRGFLVERISQVRRQQAELAAFAHQLGTVLDRLTARDPGPERCGKGCGCETDLDMSPDRPEPDHMPWSCSLSDDALVSRIGHWRAVAAAAISVQHTAEAVRVVLPCDAEMIATVAKLSAEETICCVQTRFVLEVTSGQVTLTAQAPGAPGLLEALFPAGGCRDQ